LSNVISFNNSKKRYWWRFPRPNQQSCSTPPCW